MTTPDLQVVYEDNHLLGVFKPAGLLVQGDKTGDPTLVDHAKAYLKEKYHKPGNVFVGLVHRLDRPVSGVVLLARTSKAASRLAKEFHDRLVKKTYLAVVIGDVSGDHGRIESYIERSHNRSRPALDTSPRARKAELTYQVLYRRKGLSLLAVMPITGRHHQIRVQLSGEGFSVVGDMKYGASEPLPDKSIALHSARLSVAHPVADDVVTLSAPPPDVYPWNRFAVTINSYLR